MTNYVSTVNIFFLCESNSVFSGFSMYLPRFWLFGMFGMNFKAVNFEREGTVMSAHFRSGQCDSDGSFVAKSV